MTQPAVLVAGRYRLEERIGSGAMGVVWSALDQRLGRTVAIKQMVVPPGLDDETAEEAKRRIMREGRIAARLHHPNAVSVFDVADHDGQPWLVMEYLPSRSLAAALGERGALPPAEVATIGRQLADALAAAHAAGIVHRDVKPGNVLLGDNGTVKLTDFGISHATDDVTVTQTGVLAGTPAYLAPEIARGADPTIASDVFSLGATLYTAVEGVPPFGLTDNTLALLHLVAAGAVRPPRQAGPLTAPLMRLLRADPAERPTAAHARGMFDTAVRATSSRDDRPGRPGWPAGPPGGPAAPTQHVPMAPGMRSGLTAAATTAVGSAPAAHAPAAQNTRIGLPPLPPPPAQPQRAADYEVEQPGDRRGRVVTIAIVATVVLVLGLFAYAITRGPGTSTARQTQPSLAPPVQVSASATTTTTTPPPAPPTAEELQAAVTAYYGLLPDDTEQAWALLGPGLQSGGFERYKAFWDRFESVDTQVVKVDAAKLTVRTVVVYRIDNRRPTAELRELTLVQTDDGNLLIDADTRLGPTKVPSDRGRDDGDG